MTWRTAPVSGAPPDGGGPSELPRLRERPRLRENAAHISASANSADPSAFKLPAVPFSSLPQLIGTYGQALPLANGNRSSEEPQLSLCKLEPLLQLMRPLPAKLGGLSPVALLDSDWIHASATWVRANPGDAEPAPPLSCRFRTLSWMQKHAPDHLLDYQAVQALCHAEAHGRHGEVPIVVVSHIWEAAQEADPNGTQLCMVSRTLEQLRDKYPAFPRRVGVLYDLSSLYQGIDQPRTREERTAFDTALERLHHWYAHQLTTKLVMTAVVNDSLPEHMQLRARGWPLTERVLAWMLSHNYDSGASDWATYVTTDADGRLLPQSEDNDFRILRPLLPREFKSELARCSFTNDNTTHAFAEALYRKTLGLACRSAWRLDWRDRGVCDNELRSLVPLLKKCVRLRALDLRANPSLTARSAEAFARLLDSSKRPLALPLLQQLMLPHVGRVATLIDVCTRRGIRLHVAAHAPVADTTTCDHLPRQPMPRPPAAKAESGMLPSLPP